jgi:hypothetical protein
MKSALVVASLAVASAKSFPDLGAKAQASVKKHVEKAAAKQSAGMVETSAKKDTIRTESHNKEVLQVELSVASDCSSIATTKGWQQGTCVDTIEYNVTYDGGFAMSHELMLTYTGMDIIVYAGHQCRGTMLHYGAIDLEEIGFPEFYVPGYYSSGPCVPMYASDGTTVTHYARAQIEARLEEPHYPYIIHGYSNKARNCGDRPRFWDYEIEDVTSGVCLDYEDHDGNMHYFLWDVTNCTQGNVDRVMYTDMSCSTPTGMRMTEWKKSCEFDSMKFIDEVHNDGHGEFLYEYADCGMGMYGAP